MMSDEEAIRYVNHLRRCQKGIPEKQHEYKYLKMFDASTNAFADTYGYFAAKLAQEWAESHPDVSLGRCIRSANTGLIMARSTYLVEKPDTAFIKFAEPIIRAELNKTAKKTD